MPMFDGLFDDLFCLKCMILNIFLICSARSTVRHDTYKNTAFVTHGPTKARVCVYVVEQSNRCINITINIYIYYINHILRVFQSVRRLCRTN